MRNYRTNSKGFKRLEGGIYIRPVKGNVWLVVARVGRVWKYATIWFSATPNRYTCIAAVRGAKNGNYPTRAMAVSAAEGNRVK